jgi:predicted glycogen debranching enzyme
MDRREWLVTNGLGGYASGSACDVLTRRYHGLLVAALNPPVGRRVLWSKLDASAAYAGATFDLGANRWHDGTLHPTGYRYLSSCELDGTTPVWTYRFADATLERRILMERGTDTTFVTYALLDASAPVDLTLKSYVNDRDYHGLTWAYDVKDVAQIDGSIATIRLGSGTPWYLGIDRGTLEIAGEWYYGFRYDEELARGLDAIEDLYHALTIRVTLQPGERIVVRGSLAQRDAVTLRPNVNDARVLELWRKAQPLAKSAPPWIESLILAADAFIVDRVVEGEAGKTVIAGYHWFGDWGRDTMISLPGLTLVTGRAPVARSILETFARFVDGGMLPNRFPDGGEAPEYNTVDAALWYVEAVRAYYEATGDRELVEHVMDALDSIVHNYVRGTRYGIKLDDDGLIRAGEPGVQLTWMDAKVGDWVVTPRIGKPVEINALWYNALCSLDGFAQALGRDPAPYRQLGSRARASFARFWNAETNYAYDVLDGPNGHEASIRPNALFAVSLPFRAFDSVKERAIVDLAAHRLWTSFGVRTLSSDDPQYVGTYAGTQAERDGAYHRGTAWPWLAGPFVRAHLNAYGDRVRAQRLVDAFAGRLSTYGMGTLAEIADGDAPNRERGCIAQAWSVAEVLRVWHEVRKP